MANEIRISLDNIFCDGKPKTVCVALSGGRDSVALLHCLKQLEESFSKAQSDIQLSNYANQNQSNDVAQNAFVGYGNLHIVAANVEHGIRGESSLRDSAFVTELCKRMGVELYSFTVDSPSFAKQNGYTVEQAARILRYRCFDELLDSGKCDYVALAHHLDDQIETVFMRILRGTGIRGLSGIKAVNGRYIRPLLEYTRDDISEYIARNNLEYVDDETNDDVSYTRNFLRAEIATLKQRFPAMGAAIKRLTVSAEECDLFIESQVPNIEVKDGVAYVKISDCTSTIISKRLFMRAAAALGVLQDIEERHLTLVLDLLSADSGKRLDLTHGICVHKEGDSLAFTRRFGDSQTGDTQLNVKLQIEEISFSEGYFEDFGINVTSVDVVYAKENIKNAMRAKTNVVTEDNDGKCAVLYVDADNVPSGAVIRGRLDGDYIRKFGGGTKSLGDFLTDKKVPLRTRDSLKVVADGSRILAVFGVDISADVKIDENTKRVFALTVE
ncbi:MAG: tRNA lysidine(34) synthetase TilS [Clostridia bacterium]|nr:tRNA lysidine(34) synthetase TilS [Clostridia bacterium]